MIMLLTNTWSGSVIDRVNKRRLMIGINAVRGSLVAIIPLLESIWIIYGVLLLISMFSAFFGLSSAVGGMLLTSVGYILFDASNDFLTAIFAFLFLGFLMAFANSGYATFFQNQVPVHIMGRFGSVADMVQGLIQIGLTLIFGICAEWFSLQFVCLVFSIIGTCIA